MEVASQPRRFLKRLAKSDRARIIKKLEVLSENPFPSGIRRVEGRKEKTYRLRVGDFRILYSVLPEENEVLVSIIDKRPRAYR
ncbi:MAG: type II toxin-antitoxin system RelE/ParE family toxin [Euryarchaeota archaeon]|nr:type II toxin-antitoxin system RelE/ParE family toxin [Euryarchaeota archaeon]